MSSLTPALVLQVEREQRLVAEQEGRIARERLADAQPLLLAAGERADRRVGIAAGADRVDQALDLLPIRTATGSAAPTVTVHAESDQVAGAHRRAGRDELLLRDVADPAVAATHRMPVEFDRAGVESLLAEDGLQQARLAGPVGAEHRDELAGVHVEVEPAPERAVAEAEVGVAQAEHDRTLRRVGDPVERLVTGPPEMAVTRRALSPRRRCWPSSS